MRQTKQNPADPTEAELAAHIKKAMRASCKRMRANFEKRFADDMRIVWADDEIAALVDSRENDSKGKAPAEENPLLRV
jgi:hypothetical protein